MSEIQSAKLILRSCDATPIGGNLPLTITPNNLSFVWYNINLRTLLGDMYDKYDLFNLCLNTVSTSIGEADFGADDNDLNVLINLEGLPFINQTYNIKSLGNTNKTTLCSFTFLHSTSASQYFYSNNINTFGKNQELVNLTLTYQRIEDGEIPTTAANPYPQVCLIFDILGVNSTKHSLTEHRLIK